MRSEETSRSAFKIGEWLIQPSLNEISNSSRSLRVEPPDLDPDDAFVARLALAARYSPRPVRRAHRFGSGRLLLATAGIAVVTTGGAYAAVVLGPLGPLDPLGRHDSPPHHKKSPGGPSEGTEPVPASPKGNGNSGKPSGKPSANPTGKPTGQPTGQPTATPGGSQRREARPGRPS